MGRVRVLDETKKREICTLLTEGMSYQRIASYVGCSRRTILNERRADEVFDQRLRQAQMSHELSPLHAMRKFATTHWRAAAWMLEREERLERTRREERRQQQQWQPSDFEQLAQRAQNLVKQADIIQLTGQPIAEQVAQLIREAARKQESAKAADLDDWALEDWGPDDWEDGELDNEDCDEGELDSEEIDSTDLEPEEESVAEEEANSFPRGNLSTEGSPPSTSENRVKSGENVAPDPPEIDSHSIELAEVGNNRPDSPSPVAITAAALPDSLSGCAAGSLAGLEYPRIGPAGSNGKPDRLGTAGAVADVGRAVAIDVHPRVDIAAGEVDANELTSRIFLRRTRRGLLT